MSNPVLYKQKASGADISRYMKAIALPAGILLLSLFAISKFAAFGTKIIAPLTGFMWIVGAGAAFWLPSQRQTILKETHVTIAIYLVSLTILKELIALISGVSSEMLMAAFGQAIPVTGGSTMSGWLQTVMWITSVMTPFGFVTMQGKKVISFKRSGSKVKTLARLRSIRDDHYDHTQ